MCCLLLLQTEKPERRHTFASLALRKRYSYLAEPALSEFDIFTNKPFDEYNNKWISPFSDHLNSPVECVINM